MADKLWSFLRGFSTLKFYEAAQQGGLNGVAPFTFGAIFATTQNPPLAGQAIFGNSVIIGTGFGITQAPATGIITAFNGTVAQPTGPVVAATAAPLPPATDLTSSENLANAFYSEELAGSTVGTSRSSESPHSVQLVIVHVVVGGSNQIFYVNGHQISSIARGLATSGDPVVIGAGSPGHTIPFEQGWLAGAFYHNDSMAQADILAMTAACFQAKDLVGPSRLVSATDPAYMWSVKRGNFDARANWVSDGSAATPITMVRNGSWNAAIGTLSNVIAADVPLSQI